MTQKKKIFIVFGTRPETIKLAPIIHEFKKNDDVNVRICVFRQHKKMLDQMLHTFSLKPDFNFSISMNDKDLLGSSVNIFKKVKTLLQSGIGILRFLFLLKREKPDMLIVQGDTATVLLAVFLAYFFKISIAHVEAGLRTYDKYSPFPEEMNRQLLARLADLHFAPTERAKQNLLQEHIPEKNIHVVGNTAIDTLLWTIERQKNPEIQKKLSDWFRQKYNLDFEKKKPAQSWSALGRKIILVTAHRRENFGEGLQNICNAIVEIAKKRNDVVIVYPVHLNPNVSAVVRVLLSHKENIILTDPLEYEQFVFLMSASYIILTDSGGIQEEAPSLKKPVLVMRENTERQEGVISGVSKLVGTKTETIVTEVLRLLDNQDDYQKMTVGENPYGDGFSTRKIIKAIK